MLGYAQKHSRSRWNVDTPTGCAECSGVAKGGPKSYETAMFPRCAACAASGSMNPAGIRTKALEIPLECRHSHGMCKVLQTSCACRWHRRKSAVNARNSDGAKAASFKSGTGVSLTAVPKGADQPLPEGSAPGLQPSGPRAAKGFGGNPPLGLGCGDPKVLVKSVPALSEDVGRAGKQQGTGMAVPVSI